MHVLPDWRRDEPAAPVRLVHLGLGAFARAHLIRYTDRANALVDPDERWGVAAFTGRSPRAAQVLAAQDGRYTLLERSADGDRLTTVDALVEVHDGADRTAFRDLVARPEVGVVTTTVTEAGYRRGADGDLDLADPDVAADRAALSTAPTAPDARLRTVPGRLVDGLLARRSAGAGPIALVACDNLPDNGAVLGRVVRRLAAEVDPTLVPWVDRHVSFVSTVVDRITPATTDADRAAAWALTGRADASPVVTEPFSEWVLDGRFPAGRPAWDRVGARFVDDLRPFEQRKLWLLNAGHSLLAYAGLARGRTTVAEAFADEVLRGRLEAFWTEARAVLPLPRDEVDAALDALRARFANARVEHRLAQIAKDGSQKLPIRVLAVARARRCAGLPVGSAGAGVLASWLQHLRTHDVRTDDPGAAPLAARLAGLAPGAAAELALDRLAPDLASDADLVAAVAAALVAQTVPA